jgi:hypothetical protein
LTPKSRHRSLCIMSEPFAYVNRIAADCIFVFEPLEPESTYRSTERLYLTSDIARDRPRQSARRAFYVNGCTGIRSFSLLAKLRDSGSPLRRRRRFLYLGTNLILPDRGAPSGSATPFSRIGAFPEKIFILYPRVTGKLYLGTIQKLRGKIPQMTVITSFLTIVRSALAFLVQRHLPESLPLAISPLPRQARATTAVVARTAV